MAWDDTKIANDGATAAGKLSASEWNSHVEDQKERLKNISEDNSPSLGGQLDANENSIINLSYIEYRDNSPYIRFAETDQSSPAGRFRILIENDIMKLQGRNSDDDSFNSILDLYRVASNTASELNTSLDIDGTMNITSGNTYQIDGSDVVDQDVTSGSAPDFSNSNMSGDISVWNNDSDYISDITNEPIEDLSDVSITSVADGDGLVYSSDDGAWVNTDIATQSELDSHIDSDGSSHTYIDQDVTSGSSPDFDNANMSGDISVWTNDADYISDITNEPIGDLSNVSLTSLSSNDIIKYDGSDFVNVDFDTEVSDNTDVSDNTTHRTSDGTDHTYIDQDVTSGSSPTLDNANMTGDISVWTNDSNYISDITGEPLGDLSDVNISSAEDNQALVYNSTSGDWENKKISGGPYIIVSTDSSGDYETDGTDDDVQIQDAIDEIETAGGGTVYIKAGNYTTGSPIEPKSNVNIYMDNDAVIERDGNFNIFSSTSELSDIEIRGGQLCDDTEINEVFNLENINNTNIVLRNINFIKNGGRCIYVGGSFTVDNCVGIDVAQFIGTPDIGEETDPPKPYVIITNCRTENQSFTGAENEAIDINWQGEGMVTISDCVSIGYLENHYEMNVTEFSVTNCHAYCPDSSDVNAFTCNVQDGVTKGSFVNCHVYDIGDGAVGFFFGVCDGVSAIGCTAQGRESGTPVGTGFYANGGTSSSVQMIGCYGKDLDIGIDNEMDNELQVIGWDYDNVSTSISDKSPHIVIGKDQFYDTGGDVSNVWEGQKIRIGGDDPLILYRYDQNIEKLEVSMDDYTTYFDYYQDETDSSDHSIMWRTFTDATGDHEFTFNKANSDGSSETLIGGFVNLEGGADNYQKCLRIGDYYLWMDTNDDLRYSSTAPTSDDDGSKVAGTATGDEVDASITDHGTVGSDPSIDLSTSPVHRFSCGSSNVTPSFTDPTNPGYITLIIEQDSVGDRDVTLTNWYLAGGSISLTSDADAIDVYCFYFDGSNYWETSRSLDVDIQVGGF